MYNIACLYPKYFAQMAEGTKEIEYRWRQRPDPRLERIEPGEPVLFLECRSERALLANIVSVERKYADGKYLYEIRISESRRLFSFPMRRLQGWIRRTEEAMAPYLELMK
jgi:hypothetical protein